MNLLPGTEFLTKNLSPQAPFQFDADVQPDTKKPTVLLANNLADDFSIDRPIWTTPTAQQSTPDFSHVRLLVPTLPAVKSESVNPTLPAKPHPCSLSEKLDFDACMSLSHSDSWNNVFDLRPLSPVQPARPTSEKFHLSSALWQSFEFLVVEHAFRLASDDAMRYSLVHKPFWHDYLASADHFNMSRWGDGDSFLVNYIGHPMEGAVSGYIFLNNDPRGRTARFGKSSVYWKSRLKAFAWAAAYSAYFEIGPILSETAIGNVGGFTYVPDCGLYPCTKYPGKQLKPPTNNTGWVDFVITPTLGLGWIVLEDFIDTELIDRLADGSPALKYKILRGALQPSHTFANLFAGKSPWFRYQPEGTFRTNFGSSLRSVSDRPAWKDEPRFNTGVQFISMSFPLESANCTTDCRHYSPGVGFNFTYRFANYAFFDSVVNVFPSSDGKHAGVQEGLVGLKLGHTGRTWGLFANVRGGTIHYDQALVPGTSAVYESTYRFALDLGGTVEYYASRKSTFRLNMGTTLVHYLEPYPDPKQPPTTVLSDQYYSLKGSPYFASGYVYRF